MIESPQLKRAVLVGRFCNGHYSQRQVARRQAHALWVIVQNMSAAPEHHVEVHRCDPASDRSALAIAARAWPATERSAYGQAIENLVAQGLATRVVLLAARRGDVLLAAQVAQMLPGNAAITWPPQFEAEC